MSERQLEGLVVGLGCVYPNPLNEALRNGRNGRWVPPDSRYLPLYQMYLRSGLTYLPSAPITMTDVNNFSGKESTNIQSDLLETGD